MQRPVELYEGRLFNSCVEDQYMQFSEALIVKALRKYKKMLLYMSVML
jgi:hypothetical protein